MYIKFKYLVIIISFIICVSSCQTIKYLKLSSDKWAIEYSQKDEIQAKEVSKLLDKKYSNIIKFLNPEFNKKITIKIYPDLQSFNDARSIFGISQGKPNGGNSVGSTRIMLVASNIYDTAIHELTHLVIYSFAGSPNRNSWINESICYYLGEQKYGSVRYLKLYYKEHNYFNSFSQDQYYTKTLYYMGQYIFDHYSNEQIKKLITSQSVDSALGINSKKYWESWCNWVENIT